MTDDDETPIFEGITHSYGSEMKSSMASVAETFAAAAEQYRHRTSVITLTFVLSIPAIWIPVGIGAWRWALGL